MADALASQYLAKARKRNPAVEPAPSTKPKDGKDGKEKQSITQSKVVHSW